MTSLKHVQATGLCTCSVIYACVLC